MSRSSSTLSLAIVLALVLVVTPDDAAGLGEAGLPNLRVTTLHVDSPTDPIAHAANEGVYSVTIVVTNAGSQAASSVLTEFSEILPTGSRRLLSSHHAPFIPAGGKVEHQTTWKPPANRIGDLDLVAAADPMGRVVESDEYDNTRHARASARIPQGIIYPSRSPASPTDGPALLGSEWAAYLFDEFDWGNPAHGLLLDRAANGRHARLPTDPVSDVGISGLGARFDGAGSYVVDWPGPSGETPQAGVSFWIALDERPEFGKHVWSVPAGECFRQGLEVRPDGRIRFHASSAAGGCANVLDSTTRLVPGQWTHVAVAWLGSHAVLYVDGEVEDRSSTASPPTPVRGDFHIGALNLNALDGTVTGHLDDAVVDDFRIHERAPTPGDVAVLFALGQKV